MDDGGGLENRYTGYCIVGSNPTPSAIDSRRHQSILPHCNAHLGNLYPGNLYPGNLYPGNPHQGCLPGRPAGLPLIS